MAVSSRAVYVSIFLLGVLFGCYHFSTIALAILIAVLSIACGIGAAIFTGPARERSRYPVKCTQHVTVHRHVSQIKQYPSPYPQAVVFSHALDSRIQEVLDLAHRHHISPFYSQFGNDSETFYRSCLPDVWTSLCSLKKRVFKVDMLQLVTQDFVQVFINHFQYYRNFPPSDSMDTLNDDSYQTNFQANIARFPYLADSDSELHFLQQICDVLFCAVLPRHILHSPIVRTLLREFLISVIIKPTIDKVCDPDYFNQYLIQYLQTQEKGVNKAKTKYSKAATYEAFVKIIHRCRDLQELHHLRELILTDIIQAKAVLKLKNEKTQTGSVSLFDLMPMEKAEQLRTRKNLSAYVNQLANCKTVCERRIKKLGGPDYLKTEAVATGLGVGTGAGPSSVRLTFEQIMSKCDHRRAFMQFLSSLGAGHILECWEQLDVANAADDVSYCAVLKNVYNVYLKFGAEKYIDADPEIVRQFSKVNSDHSEAVGLLKKHLYTQLQVQFYYSFLSSEYYQRLKRQGQQEDGFREASEINHQYFSETLPVKLSNASESKYEERLKCLEQELKETNTDLSSIPPATLNSGSSRRRQMLENKRKGIITEIHQLEDYVERTDDWFASIGQWTVEVLSVDVEDGAAADPSFMLIVSHGSTAFGHMIGEEESEDDIFESLLPHSPSSNGSEEPEGSRTPNEVLRDPSSGSIHGSESVTSDVSEEVMESNPERYRDGWVVQRKLSEFRFLHEKLFQVNSALRFPPTPKGGFSIAGLSLSSSPDPPTEVQWKAYRAQLTEYLSFVLRDDKLQGSEDLFHFLSPPYQHIKKKTKSSTRKQSLPAQLREFLPAVKFESFIDPLFLLLVEVFELGDWKMIIRKQLIEMMQIVFGSDFERKIQEGITWYVSEPMLVQYIQLFKESMWPNGVPNSESMLRSDREKAATRVEARERLLKNPPVLLQSMLGSQNCQIGLEKIFHAFQSKEANKQLIYALTEALLPSIVPELKHEIEKHKAN